MVSVIKGFYICREVGARSTTRSSIKYQTNSVQSCKFRTSGKGKHVSKISEKNNTVKSADFDFFAFKTFFSLFFNLNFKQLNNKKSIDMIGNSLKEKKSIICKRLIYEYINILKVNYI